MKIDGTQRIVPGMKIHAKVNRNMTVTVNVEANWLGWFLFTWRKIQKEYKIRWFEYPKALWMVARTAYRIKGKEC